MTQVTELETAQSVETTAAASDRRRPGRLGAVNPELIPILRGQEPEIQFDDEDVDQTAAIRGLFFGVVLSVPAWVGIAYAGSFFLSK